MPTQDDRPSSTLAGPALGRQIGLGSAVALNMLEMVGVGPFITLPLIVSAMGGPQAMLGWILGALLAVCDGLVWAELGAALPEAGGSYAFLRAIYGKARGNQSSTHDAGRLLSFLFVWQFTFSAPLVMASGALGLAQYAVYLYPRLSGMVLAPATGGMLAVFAHVQRTSLLAVSVCVLAVVLLYRRLAAVERLAWLLWAGVALTMLAVIIAGVTHFHPALAFSFPPVAFRPSGAFFKGLGAATLIATYDYWGYYTVCFLGGEIRDPGRAIPRAVLLSIGIVAALYLVMNISVLGVVPWQEMTGAHRGASGYAVIAVLLERTFGHLAARVIAWMVIWTAFGSLFSLLLGGSRVPYAAARDGNYFRSLGQLHPRGNFPGRSLLLLGSIACVFCFFDLRTVIQALVAIRIVLQFLLQQVGVMVLRRRQPDLPRPFRMWLYPVPALVACAGSVFLLISRHGAARELWAALAVAVSGSVVYLVRMRRQRD